MEELRAYLTGKSMKDFAQRVKISGPYLSQIVGGVRTPSFRLMERIEIATDGAVPVEAWKSQQAAGEAA